MTLGEVYGLNFDIKSFAVDNHFVQQATKVSYLFGEKLQPFCMMAGQEQQSHGVVDISTLGALHNPEITFIREIADMRRQQYKEQGISIPQHELKDKLLYYDYLMSISICYIEIPKYHTKNGVAQNTYDKFLVTKNPEIMASWTSMSAGDMQNKYSHRIAVDESELRYNDLRAVRLTSTKKENKIVCPRKPFNIEKMTCTPLFMTYIS